jgi:hypothetical protein
MSSVTIEEESHQALNGQRRTKDVAHVVRVIGPVGTELEFKGDASGHAQRKVDAEELAPKAGHVLPDHLAGHHVDALHDHQKPHHAQRQGHKKKVVHRRRGKLQPREVNELF